MRHLLALVIVVSALPSLAQSPPTDLTELDIEDILALHIRRDAEPERHPWSIAYRAVYARFDGNRDGTRDLSYDEVVWDRDNGEARTADNFPVVPLEINQQAHLLEVGYEIDSRTTVSVLLPFIHQSTDHNSVIPGFEMFVITSSGVGDVSVSVSRRIWNRGAHHVALSAGLSLPVGSIDEIGPTPRDANNDTQLPYTMQIGSGTYDLLPGLAYSATAGDWAWGAQVGGTVRLGETDRDYTLGNRLNLGGWVKTAATPWLTPGLGLTLRRWGEIDGMDDDLAIGALPVSPYPAAVTDPTKFGGTKLHATLGATLTRDAGILQGHALQLEVSIPVYQDLNGPQPKEIYRLGLGWSWTLQ